MRIGYCSKIVNSNNLREENGNGKYILDLVSGRF